MNIIQSLAANLVGDSMMLFSSGCGMMVMVRVRVRVRVMVMIIMMMIANYHLFFVIAKKWMWFSNTRVFGVFDLEYTIANQIFMVRTARLASSI